MSTETTKPYAICLEEGCSVEHADQKAISEHSRATMGPVGENTMRGHAWRVVNPSPEEIAERAAQIAVGRAIDAAQERAFEELDREIESGRVTEEAVTEELRYFPDFGDGWDEWRREAGE